MKALTVVLLSCTLLVPLGCDTTPAPATVPTVTLLSRTQMDGSIILRFCFTDLDRVDWKGKVLKAQVLKEGESPTAEAAKFFDPAPEFTVEVGVGKPREREDVLFVPIWGKSKDGFIDDPQHPTFCEGAVTVPDSAGKRINQILETCKGPGVAAPFDPDRGVNLVTVGCGKDACHLKVWVDRITR